METKTTFSVTSSALCHGEQTPMRMVYDAMGCTGQNRSPDVPWLGAPEGTKSYALAYARFMFASRDHVLAQSELVGLYGRG